jgi:hypothetical protein
VHDRVKQHHSPRVIERVIPRAKVAGGSKIVELLIRVVLEYLFTFLSELDVDGRRPTQMVDSFPPWSALIRVLLPQY